jgi:hypothetical protein
MLSRFSLGSRTPKASASGRLRCSPPPTGAAAISYPALATSPRRHERLLAELRVAVGDAASEAAYARGATLDVDDAEEIALRLAGGAQASPAPA